MSRDDSVLKSLQRQEDRKLSAREKLKRTALETIPLPKNLRGYKILACPLIKGVNLDKNATGFGDIQVCPTSSSDGMGGSSFSRFNEHLVLTKMAEIFVGILLQKGIGTPSMLTADLSEKDALDHKSPDKIKKIRPILLTVFKSTYPECRSGLFSPEFARFWKVFHMQAGISNFLELRVKYGYKTFQDRKDRFLKSYQVPKQPSPTNPIGPAGAAGAAASSSEAGAAEEDEEMLIEDSGDLLATGRSAALDKIRKKTREKMCIILYRVFRRKVTSNDHEEHWREEESTRTGLSENDHPFTDVDDDSQSPDQDEFGTRALTERFNASLNIGGRTGLNAEVLPGKPLNYNHYMCSDEEELSEGTPEGASISVSPPGSSSSLSSSSDAELDSMPFVPPTLSDLLKPKPNRKEHVVEDPEVPNANTNPTNEASAVAPLAAEHFDVNIASPQVVQDAVLEESSTNKVDDGQGDVPLPTSKFLPFESPEFSREEDGSTNLYEYFYVPEAATKPASADFDPSDYQCFGTSETNSRSSIKTSDAEDVGCVLIGVVLDPNWNPATALRALIANPTYRQIKKGKTVSNSGKATSKSKDPCFCDWSYGTGTDHASYGGLNAITWNRYAKLYEYDQKRFARERAEAESLKNHDKETDFERFVPITPSKAGNSGQSVAGGGLSESCIYSVSLSKHPEEVSNPESIFTLQNAILWMKRYGGDASLLNAVVREEDDPNPILNPKSPQTHAGRGPPHIKSCNFEDPRVFFGVPYKYWSWPNKDVSGLNKYHFPWCSDPVVSFVKHAALGLKNTAVVQSAGSQHVVSVKVGGEVKEHVVSSLSDANSSSMMRDLWKNENVKDSGATQGFNLDHLDLPDAPSITRALQLQSQPQTKTFSTQLTPDDVSETLQLVLERKNGNISRVCQNNMILMLQERLGPAYELVLKEKPKENLVSNFPSATALNEGDCSPSHSSMASLDPSSEGVTTKWFESPSQTNPSGCNPFVDQFRRYVCLRESFEDMAFRELDVVLHNKNTILTKAMAHLVNYEEKMMRKPMDFGFVRHDLATDAFGNYADKLALEVRFLLHIPHATHHFVLVVFGVQDATRFGLDLHFNCLNSGPGSTSKSFSSEAALGCLVEGTVLKADDSTARANNIETEDPSDRTWYIDELNKRQQDGGKGGHADGAADPQAGAFRRMLTGGCLTLAEFMWVTLKDGTKIRHRRDLVTYCQGCVIGCLNDNCFTAATLTRFYNAIFSRTNISFSEAVMNELNLRDYNDFMHLYLNKIAAKEPVDDLAHLQRLEDVKAMVRSARLNSSLNLGKEKITKERLEMLDLGNNLLSKVGDMLTTKFLPVVNVPQSMFLENLTGDVDAPFKKDNAVKKLAEKIRLQQVLTSYVWKLIHVGALPAVNLTLAHMVAQKYFAHLKSSANVVLDNYRVYTRIMIMCRIVCIMDAILQVYVVEGCDIDPKTLFNFGSLKATKPYLFANAKHAIFALTLLADEYMGPFDSTIVGHFARICSYEPKKGVMGELNSFSDMFNALKKLKALDSQEELLESLRRLRNKKTEHFAWFDKVVRAEETYQRQKVSKVDVVSPTSASSAHPRRSESNVSEPSSSAGPSLHNMSFGTGPSKSHSKSNLAADSTGTSNTATTANPTVNPSPTGPKPKSEEQLKREAELAEIRAKKLDETLTRIMDNDLLPHEVYLISNKFTNSPKWEIVSHDKVEGEQEGNLGTNETGVMNCPANPRLNKNRGGAEKEVAVNLNNLQATEKHPWVLSGNISALMLGMGPSVDDIARTLKNLSQRKVDTPWSYKRPFSGQEIEDMAGKTLEELLEQGVLVKNKSYPLCNINREKCTLSFYALTTSSCNSMEVITRALDGLIYEGMKPARYQLGIMADPNRGKWAFWDVTEEKIAKCGRPTFDVFTGGYMTERERNVVFYGDAEPEADDRPISIAQALALIKKDVRMAKDRMSATVTTTSGSTSITVTTASARAAAEAAALAKSKEYTDTGGDEDEDQIMRDIVDASEWFADPRKADRTADGSCVAGMGKSSNFLHSKNVLRIREDVDEWVAKRHFLNSAIPFGPHPLDPTGRLCWYYRPLKVVSPSTGECKYDAGKLEYRDFPTAYNQQMRSIYYLCTRRPEVLKRMSLLGFMDPEMKLKALKHYSWLDSTFDKSVISELESDLAFKPRASVPHNGDDIEIEENSGNSKAPENTAATLEYTVLSQEKEKDKEKKKGKGKEKEKKKNKDKKKQKGEEKKKKRDRPNAESMELDSEVTPPKHKKMKSVHAINGSHPGSQGSRGAKRLSHGPTREGIGLG
jgi:hypothetical protein